MGGKNNKFAEDSMNECQWNGRKNEENQLRDKKECETSDLRMDHRESSNIPFITVILCYFCILESDLEFIHFNILSRRLRMKISKNTNCYFCILVTIHSF